LKNEENDNQYSEDNPSNTLCIRFLDFFHMCLQLTPVAPARIVECFFV